MRTKASRFTGFSSEGESQPLPIGRARTQQSPEANITYQLQRIATILKVDSASPALLIQRIQQLVTNNQSLHQTVNDLHEKLDDYEHALTDLREDLKTKTKTIQLVTSQKNQLRKKCKQLTLNAKSAVNFYSATNSQFQSNSAGIYGNKTISSQNTTNNTQIELQRALDILNAIKKQIDHPKIENDELVGKIKELQGNYIKEHQKNVILVNNSTIYRTGVQNDRDNSVSQHDSEQLGRLKKELQLKTKDIKTIAQLLGNQSWGIFRIKSEIKQIQAQKGKEFPKQDKKEVVGFSLPNVEGIESQGFIMASSKSIVKSLGVVKPAEIETEVARQLRQFYENVIQSMASKNIYQSQVQPDYPFMIKEQQSATKKDDNSLVTKLLKDEILGLQTQVKQLKKNLEAQKKTHKNTHGTLMREITDLRNRRNNSDSIRLGAQVFNRDWKVSNTKSSGQFIEKNHFEVSYLQDELKEAREALQSTAAAIKDLRKQHKAEIEVESRQFNTKIALMTEDMQGLQKDYKSLLEQLKNKKKQAEEINKTAQEMKQTFIELLGDHQKLTNQYYAQIANLQVENTKLREDIQRLEQERTNRISYIQKLQENIQRQKDSIKSAWYEQARRQQDYLKQKESEVEIQAQQLSRASKSLSQAEAQIQDLKKALQALNDQFNAQSNKMSILHDNSTVLRERSLVIQEENIKFRQKIERITNECSTLRSVAEFTNKAIEELREGLKGHQKGYSLLENRFKELAQELNRERDQKDHLTDQIQTQTIDFNELKQDRNLILDKLTEVQTQLQKTSNQYNELQLEYKAAEEKQSMLSNAKNQFENRYFEMADKASILEKEFSRTQQHMFLTDRQRNNLLSAYTNLENQFNLLKDQFSQVEQKNITLERELTNKQTELFEMVQTVRKNAQQVQQLRMEASQTKTQSNFFSKTTEQLNSDLQSLRNVQIETENDRNRYAKDVQRLRNETDRLTEQISRAKWQIEQLRGENTHLNQENQAYHAQLAKIRLLVLQSINNIDKEVDEIMKESQVKFTISDSQFRKSKQSQEEEKYTNDQLKEVVGAKLIESVSNSRVTQQSFLKVSRNKATVPLHEIGDSLYTDLEKIIMKQKQLKNLYTWFVNTFDAHQADREGTQQLSDSKLTKTITFEEDTSPNRLEAITVMWRRLSEEVKQLESLHTMFEVSSDKQLIQKISLIKTEMAELKTNLQNNSLQAQQFSTAQSIRSEFEQIVEALNRFSVSTNCSVSALAELVVRNIEITFNQSTVITSLQNIRAEINQAIELAIHSHQNQNQMAKIEIGNLKSQHQNNLNQMKEQIKKLNNLLSKRQEQNMLQTSKAKGQQQERQLQGSQTVHKPSQANTCNNDSLSAQTLRQDSISNINIVLTRITQQIIPQVTVSSISEHNQNVIPTNGALETSINLKTDTTIIFQPRRAEKHLAEMMNSFGSNVIYEHPQESLLSRTIESQHNSENKSNLQASQNSYSIKIKNSNTKNQPNILKQSQTECLATSKNEQTVLKSENQYQQILELESAPHVIFRIHPESQECLRLESVNNAEIGSSQKDPEPKFMKTSLEGNLKQSSESFKGVSVGNSSSQEQQNNSSVQQFEGVTLSAIVLPLGTTIPTASESLKTLRLLSEHQISDFFPEKGSPNKQKKKQFKPKEIASASQNNRQTHQNMSPQQLAIPNLRINTPGSSNLQSSTGSNFLQHSNNNSNDSRRHIHRQTPIPSIQRLNRIQMSSTAGQSFLFNPIIDQVKEALIHLEVSQSNEVSQRMCKSVGHVSDNIQQQQSNNSVNMSESRLFLTASELAVKRPLSRQQLNKSQDNYFVLNRNQRQISVFSQSRQCLSEGGSKARPRINPVPAKPPPLQTSQTGINNLGKSDHLNPHFGVLPAIHNQSINSNLANSMPERNDLKGQQQIQNSQVKSYLLHQPRIVGVSFSGDILQTQQPRPVVMASAMSFGLDSSGTLKSQQPNQSVISFQQGTPIRREIVPSNMMIFQGSPPLNGVPFGQNKSISIVDRQNRPNNVQMVYPMINNINDRVPTFQMVNGPVLQRSPSPTLLNLNPQAPSSIQQMNAPSSRNKGSIRLDQIQPISIIKANQANKRPSIIDQANIRPIASAMSGRLKSYNYSPNHSSSPQIKQQSKGVNKLEGNNELTPKGFQTGAQNAKQKNGIVRFEEGIGHSRISTIINYLQKSNEPNNNKSVTTPDVQDKNQEQNSAQKATNKIKIPLLNKLILEKSIFQKSLAASVKSTSEIDVQSKADPNVKPSREEDSISIYTRKRVNVPSNRTPLPFRTRCNRYGALGQLTISQLLEYDPEVTAQDHIRVSLREEQLKNPIKVSQKKPLQETAASKQAHVIESSNRQCCS